LGKNSSGDDWFQKANFSLLVKVLDNDLHPPQFMPCPEVGGSCLSPLYEATTKEGVLEQVSFLILLQGIKYGHIC